MNSITWLIAGAVLGWLTSIIIRRRSGQLVNILVGMVGAFVAGYLVPPLFRVGPTNPEMINLPALMISLVGAVFLLAVVNFLRRENNVKTEVIERKWAQVRGKIHARWGKLTDEDVANINGNHNRFIVTLEKRYGCANKEAEDQIQRYLKSVLVDSGHPLVYEHAQIVDHLPRPNE